MEQIFRLYDRFLQLFPPESHSVVSVFTAVFLILSLYKLARKNALWLILLTVFVPVSVPILKKIWDGILEVLRYLMSK